MSNRFTKWLDGNKTSYMVCFTDGKAKTSLEAFNTYNATAPKDLQVTLENYSWQRLDTGIIKSWIYTCDNSLRKDLIKFINNSSILRFLSQGTTKRKFKHYFHFGID